MGWLIWLIVAVFVIWFLSGLKVVGRREFGVKYFFERMVPVGADPENVGNASFFTRYGFCRSGLYWVLPLPNCGISRLPTKRFALDYEPRLVMSKGEKNSDSDVEQGKQILIINAMVYVEFDKTFASAVKAIVREVPLEETALVNKTNGLVDGAFRAAAGSMSWSKATEIEGRKLIGEKVSETIEDSNAYFSLGGFNMDKIDIAIQAVDLQSQALKDAMAQFDAERIRKDSATFEADRTRIETEILGNIREELLKKGFAKEVVDEIAHRAYELQVSSDLQRESKMQVVRLIRFQSGSTIANSIAEGLAAFAEGKGPSIGDKGGGADTSAGESAPTANVGTAPKADEGPPPKTPEQLREEERMKEHQEWMEKHFGKPKGVGQ